jgi:hypothetical protein
MDATHGLHLRRTDVPAGAVDGLADALGGRVGAQVLGDLDRRGRRSWAPGRAVDRAWTFDRADRRDPRWWPQGVDVEGPLVAMTWYAKKVAGDAASQGARLTFYDVATCRYRHVLLVRPTLEDGVPGFVPLKAHAGGLVWDGDLLHVAATSMGFWTASLGDVLQVPDGPAADGWREAAFGYRYVLPVHTAHRAEADEGVDELRYSFLARAGSHLVVGEYAAGAAASGRLARTALELGGHARLEVLGDGPGHMQGAAVTDERWYVTTSHGQWRPGSVWTGTPGDFTRHRWATPMGPEDLTHDPATDLLWSVTEHPRRRWIYTMRRSWFA